jgi:hypothetical protein
MGNGSVVGKENCSIEEEELTEPQVDNTLRIKEGEQLLDVLNELNLALGGGRGESLDSFLNVNLVVGVVQYLQVFCYLNWANITYCWERMFWRGPWKLMSCYLG